MSATVACRYCHRSGFVRLEHVITKGQFYRQFYCGACDRTWEIADVDSPAPVMRVHPKRKRPVKRST